MIRLIAFGEKSDGTRNYGIDGLRDASVLVSGERAEAVAKQLVGLLQRGDEEKLAPKTRLLGEGCIREDSTAGNGLWLLNSAEKGWSAFGVRLDGWHELVSTYDVWIGEPRTDEHGQWWPAIPRNVGGAT